MGLQSSSVSISLRKVDRDKTCEVTGLAASPHFNVLGESVAGLERPPCASMSSSPIIIDSSFPAQSHYSRM
jgi:hypothetical protein